MYQQKAKKKKKNEIRKKITLYPLLKLQCSLQDVWLKLYLTRLKGLLMDGDKVYDFICERETGFVNVTAGLAVNGTG